MIGIWVEWELRQGEAWPSFGECEGVFISFTLFPPADGHPWQLCLHGWILVILDYGRDAGSNQIFSGSWIPPSYHSYKVIEYQYTICMNIQLWALWLRLQNRATLHPDQSERKPWSVFKFKYLANQMRICRSWQIDNNVVSQEGCPLPIIWNSSSQFFIISFQPSCYSWEYWPTRKESHRVYFEWLMKYRVSRSRFITYFGSI